jgi:hypothetical protein
VRCCAAPKIVLRSKTPDLVRQEFYGLMIAHFAIRGLMHEAALSDDDPDRLSFLHAVRVIGKLPRFAVFPPRHRHAFHEVVPDEILRERVVSSRNRRNFRGVNQDEQLPTSTTHR